MCLNGGHHIPDMPRGQSVFFSLMVFGPTIRNMSMMFEPNGVNQNWAGNRQTCLLQLIILLDRRLCARVCSQEFVNLVVQTGILDQAMIFWICKLFYALQCGY